MHNVTVGAVLLEYVRRMCEQEAREAELEGHKRVLVNVAARMKIAAQSLSFILAGNKGRAVNVNHLENIRQTGAKLSSQLLRELAVLALEMEKTAPGQLDAVRLQGALGESFVRRDAFPEGADSKNPQPRRRRSKAPSKKP